MSKQNANKAPSMHEQMGARENESEVVGRTRECQDELLQAKRSLIHPEHAGAQTKAQQPKVHVAALYAAPRSPLRHFAWSTKNAPISTGKFSVLPVSPHPAHTHPRPHARLGNARASHTRLVRLDSLVLDPRVWRLHSRSPTAEPRSSPTIRRWRVPCSTRISPRS